MYVKLFSTILDSSVWYEDSATRLVWIALLLMADEHGMVHAATPGVAGRARVSMADCQRALRTLEAPDPESKSQEWGGRRIEKVEGGWFILNHAKYREIRTRKQMADAERQRRHYEKKRREAGETVRPNEPHATSRPEAEAEAEAEEASTKVEAPAPPPPDAGSKGTAIVKRTGTYIHDFVLGVATSSSWTGARRLRLEAMACFDFHRWSRKIKNRVVFSDERERVTKKLVQHYGLVRCLFAIHGQVWGHPDFSGRSDGRTFRDYGNLFRSSKGFEAIEKCSNWAIDRLRDMDDPTRHNVVRYLAVLEAEKGWTPGDLDAELLSDLALREDSR